MYFISQQRAAVFRKFLPAPNGSSHFDPALEDLYQADLAAEKSRVFLQTYLLCSLLYVGFGILDMWAMPASYRIGWIVRAVVVALTALASMVPLYRRDIFVRYYTPITCATYLVWGVGIEVIILASHAHDVAWGAYYAGLILVSMALYTWTFLSPMVACAIGLTLALTYIAMALTQQRMASSPGEGLVLLANCFFLISANIVGLFSLYTREKFSRQSFLLRRELAHDLKREEAAKLESRHLSEHDALTGLPNRLRFMRKLEEMVAAVCDGSVAVLFLDLDGFKPVNDRYGHAAGDQVLRCVAQRLKESIRSTDLVARLGGDEFVIALALSDRNCATVDRVIGELQSTIAQGIEFEGRMLRVASSIGSARYPEAGRTAAELMAEADARMYQVKRMRQRRVQLVG